ncbi:ATP-binding cassette domain-containing protein [Candidatus Curtissbacteria bacterium]|nr:ATP-binding cassette domain-containing protein [Candidatus Curtissbacteria bacterium]
MSVIETKNLTKIYTVVQKEPGLVGTFKSLFHRTYEEVKAVNDISFQIDEGELVGFIGPNGAGKTTTLKCLSGLLYPTSGDISVLGFKPSERKNQFLAQIAFVMGQKNQLWWDLPPMETFLLNREIYELDDKAFKKNLKELVDLLEIGDLVNVPVKKMSLGQRMKCELVASLIHQPKVLFLDEPTIGLDILMQKKLRDFIAQYNKKHRATIILTSHYMKVIVINEGKLIFDGRLGDLVKRYAPYKLISGILASKVTTQYLGKFGQIKSYKYPQITFKVPIDLVDEITGHILRNLKLEDLNIQDVEIEDVIREVFQSKT